MYMIFSDITYGPNLNKLLGRSTFTLTTNRSYDELTSDAHNYKLTVNSLIATGKYDLIDL